MYPIFITLHVFIALAMIGLILMQQGKGADIGAAFGAGASATLFGAQGSANFLTRTTAILATLFFLNSIWLAYLVSAEHKPTSLMQSVTLPQTQPKPVSDVPELPSTAPTPVPAVQTPGVVPKAAPKAAVSLQLQPASVVTPAQVAVEPMTVPLAPQVAEPAAKPAPVEVEAKPVPVEVEVEVKPEPVAEIQSEPAPGIGEQ